MADHVVTHQPFSFPSRDNYALRGMIASPPEPEAPADPFDETARPDGGGTGGPAGVATDRSLPSASKWSQQAEPRYGHPFLSAPPEAAKRRPWEPAPESRLPFGGSEGMTQANRWGTKNGKPPLGSRGVVVVSGAVGVASEYYRSFSAALASEGFTVITYDYRGIGGSKPRDLKTFDATLTEWVLLDMAAVIDWSISQYPTNRLFLVGHSFGGQAAGLLDNASNVRAMATIASQSGYWKLIGGKERRRVGRHMRFTVPTMARLSGYMPWSRFGNGEDLPKGVALQWSRWATDPQYLLGDDTLPLDRYADFAAPVLSYTIGDDPWLPTEGDDTMMAAYPNLTERCIDPTDAGVPPIGHVGYFKESSGPLWPDLVAWFNSN
jgi:predicted alpha/beta hydrolase